MRIIHIKYLLVAMVGLYGLCIPQHVFSADLNFKIVPRGGSDAEPTVIEVRIDPQAKNLNVVEGVIILEGEISESLDVEVENGGSLLTLWPTAPAYIPKEKAIRFAGGVPQGFKQEGLLFRIRLLSTISGEVKVSWAGGKAYRNDGKGTEEPISGRSINVSLDKQNPNLMQRSSSDVTPPYFLSVEIGKDENAYGGKYFVSFHAADEMSGIARYEVIEGKSVTSVSNGVYVFEDQNRRKSVTITVYDQAGNSTTKVIMPRFDAVRNGILIILFIGFLFALRYGYNKIIKR